MGLCEQGRERFLCVTTKCNPAHERKETEGWFLLKAWLHVTDPAEEILVLSLKPVSCSTWVLCAHRIPVSVLLLKTKEKSIPISRIGFEALSGELYYCLKRKLKTGK